MPRNIDISGGQIHYENFSVEPTDIYQTNNNGETDVGPVYFATGGWNNGGFVRIKPPRHWQGYGGLGAFYGPGGGSLNVRNLHMQFLLRHGKDISRYGIGHKLVIMGGNVGNQRPMVLTQNAPITDALAVGGQVPALKYRPCADTLCTDTQGTPLLIGDPLDGAGHAELRSAEWILFQVGGIGSSDGVLQDGHTDMWLGTQDEVYDPSVLYASRIAGVDTLMQDHGSASLCCAYWGDYSSFPELGVVDTVNNTITVAQWPMGMNLEMYPDGTDVRFDNRDRQAGALPGGLLYDTDYYVMNRNVGTSTFQVAATYADAIAGINPVDITSASVNISHMSRPPLTADTYIDVCELKIAGAYISDVPVGWAGAAPPQPQGNRWRRRGGVRFITSPGV